MLGDEILDSIVREEIWRRRRRRIYLLPATIACGALVWMALK